MMRTGVRRVAPACLLAVLAGACSGDSAPVKTPPPPPAPPAPPAPPPSKLFVLGDSLSDVGNAAAAADYLLSLAFDPPTVGLCNPHDVLVVPRDCTDLYYERSRVSDGPVAVEQAAALFGLDELEPSLHVVPNRPRVGTVYAVASAKARGTNAEDLARQTDWLLLDHAPLPADAAYLIMIGGNDAIDALQADVANPNASPRPSAAVVTATVTAIRAAAERLLDFGARRLVVASVPALTSLPAVRDAARASADEAAVLAAASAISAELDSALGAMLDDLAASDRWRAPTAATIARFDVQSALTGAQDSIAAAGGNANDACFDSEHYRDSPTAERRFHFDCAPPTADATARFDRFAFFDGIHPTGAAHAALGAALAARIATQTATP